MDDEILSGCVGGLESFVFRSEGLIPSYLFTETLVLCDLSRLRFSVRNETVVVSLNKKGFRNFKINIKSVFTSRKTNRYQRT